MEICKCSWFGIKLRDRKEVFNYCLMTKEAKQRLTTFIVALILYLPNLGLVPFWEWDEPAYAGASREMLVSKDFVLPQLNNQIFLLYCVSLLFRLILYENLLCN